MISKEDKASSAHSKGFIRPLALAWELGYTIAIPIVVMALGGRFLDRYFGTGPILLLVGIFVSVLLTSFLVYRKTKKVLSQF
ncbi:MAG: hypothetical protein UY26_C0003G0034 [Candidatus Jorgensenbacteria bacterium GW2011_GWA1_48_13]|uniref:AtpZ/AtpI family protein n=1 Tax=Candidatus Jorgensenbacteria bacterium GW2011_GWB1_50_10 TaxID=1618665 RepID=A0A0G1W8L7_9BACT|nr:MAG: hypothetical protein UY26_C0003G0034 [Candidatus Jorgensenbacteria bacterium GW2011_GWA1_48_13]KKW14995.1 MAG: hypothetical protein UY55_C0002G0051 [Candidatus Jorgensenbacteria bacterium GW2011_GWB1_50_10]